MKIGVGLPNAVPGADGAVLLEWARRAEALGFSSLATIDRIAYPSYESLVTLAAAAGATQRITLVTNVLLGPARTPVLLAKQAAAVDRLSGGRFVLGVGVGSRPDDFATTGLDFHTRGRRWDRDLKVLRDVWRGERVLGAQHAIGPSPTSEGGVPILVGGMSDQAIDRTVRYGIGWTAGGAPPDAVASYADRVRAAWREAGRRGDPRIVALSYFGFGELDPVQDYLVDYYGEQRGAQFAGYVPRSSEAVRDVVAAFAAMGIDELILVGTRTEPEQLDRLAETVL